MTLQGYQQIDIDAVRLYVEDLRNLLDESEMAQRKAFLRSLVKKIIIEKEKVKLYYNIHIPPDGHADGKEMEEVGVLTIDTPTGPCRSRTCDTLIKRYRRIVATSKAEYLLST